MKKVLLLLAVTPPLAAFAESRDAAPDPVRGQKVYAACAACHGPGPMVKTGPALEGVAGRRAGTVPGFRYSRALKNSRLTWDDATLDAFLADPQARVPGNAMPYPGLPDPAQRADLIAYLKNLQ
ncbi:MAG: c-type cytochrome [Opitutaceae bacterium]|nr:c-type cytochrome [Opitutaceae bacterium]